MANRIEQKAVLLTLGRLPVALDLARSFTQLGWRVVVAEPYAMHLTRMSNSVALCCRTRAPTDDRDGYLQDLRELIERERVSLVVPVSEESMHVAALTDALPGVEIFCLPQSHILKLHDKLDFNQMARGLDLPVPSSCAAEDPRRVELAAAGDFITKPRLGCSGRGVEFHAQGAEPLFPQGALVQQKITGTELSSFSIARDGRLLGTVVYAGRATSGSVAVAFERLHQPAVESWIENFVRKSAHTGFIAFDFIVDQAGVPFAIECNPRATSGLHFFERDALAMSIVGEAEGLMPHRAEHLLQETYSNLTALWGSLLRPREFRNRFSLLRRARDVTWSKRDPKPFLLMMVNTWPLIWLALVKRKSFAEVAVLDIEWSRD